MTWDENPEYPKIGGFCGRLSLKLAPCFQSGALRHQMRELAGFISAILGE